MTIDTNAAAAAEKVEAVNTRVGDGQTVTLPRTSYGETITIYVSSARFTDAGVVVYRADGGGPITYTYADFVAAYRARYAW